MSHTATQLTITHVPRIAWLIGSPLAQAGFEMPLGRNALSIGVRYTIGLIDISKDASVKNRNLQFLAALRFP